MGHRRRLPRRLRRGLRGDERHEQPGPGGAKNGLTITKPLTIRGAGASKVTIRPAASAAPSLAGTAPFLRDGGGAVVQVNRQSGGSSDISGPDPGSVASVELGTPLAAPPPALAVPVATPDGPPAGAFVDPAEGDVVAVGETVTPTVLARDDFGVRSVAVTLDGAPFATDAVAPYELSWTPGYADLGATHTFVAAPNVCAAPATLAAGASCSIVVRFAPASEGPRVGALSVAYTAPGAAGPLVAALAGTGHVLSTSAPGTVAGTVAPTLGLTISSASSSLGAFVPGTAADYTTSVALGVTHSTGGAALTVQDPSAVATGHLVNGDVALASALLARAGSSPFAPVGSGATPLALRTFAAPVVDEPVAVTFKQPVSATEPLRTGSYAKAVVFTLSSMTP